MKTDRWKAVRRGDIYCAPACGRGCTIQEYRQAERKARALAKRLSPVDSDVKGGKWEIRIHENLGWHYRVTKGAITVYEYARSYSREPGSYGACLDICGPWGGNIWRNGKTPAQAVHRLLRDVRSQMAEMVALAKRLAA